MNTEKNKIIWIGLKKHSKDKLEVSTELDWGITEFTLLGIDFSVNLNDMLELNYNKAYTKIQKGIASWNKRRLTPLGKITVIKTFLISQLNHIFLSLPLPIKSFLQKMKDLLYKFLWDNKPDKIKRAVVTQDYKQGGLKMLNIEKFILGLKITWIRRLVRNPSSQWVTLFESSVCKINKITTFGSLYLELIKRNITNKFWIGVFDSWIAFTKIQEVKNNEEILNSPLWYNHEISEYPFFLARWHNAGISLVGQLINSNREILSLNQIKEKFHTPTLQLFEYYRIRGLIKQFIKKHVLHANLIFLTPSIPSHIKILFKSPKGSQDFYKLLNITDSELSVKTKWHNILNINIDNETWTDIFKNCFSTVQDNTLKWFQYRVIFRILGTRNLLFSMSINESPNCGFCNLEAENLQHIFVECSKVTPFWHIIKMWVRTTLDIDLN